MVLYAFLKKSLLEVNIDFVCDFGAKLARFGRHFGRPGRLWAHLGALGRVLAPLGGLLGRLWPVLRASLARLGASWRVLGASVHVLGASGCRFGSQNHPQHKPDLTWNGKRRSFWKLAMAAIGSDLPVVDLFGSFLDRVLRSLRSLRSLARCACITVMKNSFWKPLGISWKLFPMASYCF